VKGQRVLRVTGLPASPLDAAAHFHAAWLPQARGISADLVLVLPPAGHDHSAWRRAMVQELAREAAPYRVNAVAGEGEQAIADTMAWLVQAPGVTGQLLAVDGNSPKMD